MLPLRKSGTRAKFNEKRFRRTIDTSFREITKRLLNDLIDYISVSNERHVEAGAIAAKYVETLQRSNEQVVKVAGIIQRATANKGPEGLSQEEKDDLFELIQGE